MRTEYHFRGSLPHPNCGVEEFDRFLDELKTSVENLPTVYDDQEARVRLRVKAERGTLRTSVNCASELTRYPEFSERISQLTATVSAFSRSVEYISISLDRFRSKYYVCGTDKAHCAGIESVIKEFFQEHSRWFARPHIRRIALWTWIALIPTGLLQLHPKISWPSWLDILRLSAGYTAWFIWIIATFISRPIIKMRITKKREVFWRYAVIGVVLGILGILLTLFTWWFPRK